MVNKCFPYILLMVLATSCCYIGKRTVYGLPRKHISSLSDKEIDYKDIDTTAIYKLVINYHYNKYNKQYFYYERADDNSYPYVSYLKFYSDGKLSLFVIPKKDTINLTKDTFNPLKAKMGYYSVADGVIKTRIATIGDCSLYISNKHGYIVNDSLKLEEKEHHGSIFIKKVVSKELLKGWSPDW